MNSIKTAAIGRAVQADWENREFSESVKFNIRRIYDFVLEFEIGMRGKLDRLNEKLTVLERTMDRLEAQVHHAASMDIE